jgi:polysaccharide biosynthesis transport protein
MDILLLVKILWRKKWFVLAVPLIAGAAAILFTSNQIDHFRAEAQISTGFATPDQIQLTNDRFNPYNAELKFSNLLTIMNSGIVFNLLSYRLVLHDLSELNTPFRNVDSVALSTLLPEKKRIEQEFVRKHKTFSPLATSDSLFGLMRNSLGVYGYGFANLQGSLSVGRLDKTDYVKVQYVSDNPDLAAFAANAYCQEFIRYYEHLRLEETGESASFLKELADQKKLELDQKLETLKIFKSTSSIVDVQQESQQTLSQLSELQSKKSDLNSIIHGLELQIQRLNSDIEKLKSNKGLGQGDNQSILNLRSLISDLNERYISEGSSNKVILDSLNLLRGQLRTLIANMEQGVATNSTQKLYDLNSKLNDAQIEYKVALGNQASTDLKIRQLQFSMGGYASKEAQISAIESEIELASKEYLEAINKYNDAANRLSITNTLKQVVIASPPLNPMPTKRILIIGLVAFTSFCLIVFAFVIAEVFNMSIRTPERFTQLVRLPLVGYLNQIDNKSFDLKAYFSKVHSNEQIEVFKSQLRKIRFEIDADTASIILFSSLRKGQGKTFIIFSLAYSLSLINKRVLIIDTNFRSNMLSKLLSQSGKNFKLIENSFNQHLLPVSAGSNFEETTEEQTAKSLNDLIVQTIFKNVYLISNGGGIDSPAEIFSGRNFRDLLRTYANEFDYIFLEGAALNDYSDTKELVNNVDKVIAIFSTEEQIKGTDRQSISYLKSLGNKYQGSILNKADLRDLKL